MRPPILTRNSTGARRFIDAMPPAMAEQLRQLQQDQQRQADPEPPPGKASADRPESAPNELQSRVLTAHLNRVVTLFLMNGIRLTGRLIGHDHVVVILVGRDGTETLTYKHVISTVVPGLPPASPLHRQA